MIVIENLLVLKPAQRSTLQILIKGFAKKTAIKEQ